MRPDPSTVATHVLDVSRVLAALQRELPACADLAQLHAVVAHHLVPLLPVRDRVSITLIEPGGEWLRIHRIAPAAEPSATLPKVRVEGTPVGQVARDGIGRVVADVRTDPNITFGHASHDCIRSTVSVPVRVGARIVGVLNAGSRQIGACTAEMIGDMERIAAAIGPAFYRAEQALVANATPRPRSRELLGANPAFRALLAIAQRTARTDADVLITGETGVGKTELARAVHAWSARRDAPFVTVHLADLTPSLVESELFGYERGAFTGATAARIGRFEAAEGGTILLDEIGETPRAIQTKLLRVIQDRCFERVGGGRTIEANVRVIAATNIDLRAAVARGEFREDLYFRLGVVPLHVPPLRERRDDLEVLADAILARICAADGRTRTLGDAARTRIRAYAWPGNVRELESALRRATILEDTAELALAELAPAPAAETTATDPAPERWSTLDEHERAYIERVLQAHDSVEGPRGAARVLGVPPSTLRSRMKQLGITRRASRGRKGSR